jgi:outer membrane receptor protein involved in Fe transport
MFQTIASRLIWSAEGNTQLVMIDGREANFDPLGFPVWEAEPVFLEDIERIEVIRGPGSALYGANAFTGVVSITTREIPEETTAEVLTMTGEAGRVVAGLRASTKLGDWGILVSGGGDMAGEFVDPRESAKRMWKARALVERRWAGSKRILIEDGMSFGEGAYATPLGTVQATSVFNNVRLAYDSEDLRGQLYWQYAAVELLIDTLLEYGGLRLARFLPAPIKAHVADAQFQWTPPVFWEPLLLIGGGGIRASWMGSDHMLDAETFTDPTSSGYHQLGIDHWEVRTGAFIHGEYTPADWITITGGMRIDYNTQTDWFGDRSLPALGRGPFVPQALLCRDGFPSDGGVSSGQSHPGDRPGQLPGIHDPGRGVPRPRQ